MQSEGGVYGLTCDSVPLQSEGCPLGPVPLQDNISQSTVFCMPRVNTKSNQLHFACSHYLSVITQHILHSSICIVKLLSTS